MNSFLSKKKKKARSTFNFRQGSFFFFKTLIKLYLQQCEIDDYRIQYFAEYLKQNQVTKTHSMKTKRKKDEKNFFYLIQFQHILKVYLECVIEKINKKKNICRFYN